jgi:exonuclease III
LTEEELQKSVSHDSLDAVTTYFPAFRELLESLFQENESFRSLCGDFRVCAQAVDYWCHSAQKRENASTYCEEYRALLEDLKNELEDMIGEDRV